MGGDSREVGTERGRLDVSRIKSRGECLYGGFHIGRVEGSGDVDELATLATALCSVTSRRERDATRGEGGGGEKWGERPVRQGLSWWARSSERERR